MPHVLVVDADGTSLQSTVTLLERARYQVSRANDGRNTLRVFAKQAPDLILLEAEFPDQDGIEICKRIRRTSDVPIIFYTFQASAEERVLGLRAGADDYVSKASDPSELLARMRAVLRRAERARKPPTSNLRTSEWTLDPVNQVCVMSDGKEIELTPREVHLLAFLMNRSSHVCTTSQIIRHVWGYASEQDRSILATSVWRLRAKLEGEPQKPRHILTVRNVGYKFVP